MASTYFRRKDPFNVYNRYVPKNEVGLANKSFSWKSPKQFYSFYNSLKRDEYGVPLDFIAAGGADGANVYGTGGPIHFNFASNTTDRNANIHDYLYTNMGSNDPFFSSYDRSNPDKKLVKDIFSSGNYFDSAVVGTGLLAGSFLGLTQSHNQNYSNPFSPLFGAKG